MKRDRLYHLVETEEREWEPRQDGDQIPVEPAVQPALVEDLVKADITKPSPTFATYKATSPLSMLGSDAENLSDIEVCQLSASKTVYHSEVGVSEPGKQTTKPVQFGRWKGEVSREASFGFCATETVRMGTISR